MLAAWLYGCQCQSVHIHVSQRMNPNDLFGEISQCLLEEFGSDIHGSQMITLTLAMPSDLFLDRHHKVDIVE